MGRNTLRLKTAAKNLNVSNVLIRAYVLTNDGSGSRPIQVAETTSDEEGAYRLLIAPTSDGE